MPRPRGGDWLEDEAAFLRRQGVDLLVSALTDPELLELDLAREEEICRAAGLRFLRVPIDDLGTPGNLELYARIVADMGRTLGQGGCVVAHCRQGIGRATLLAVGALTELGPDIPPSEALDRIEAARGRPVPDTESQRRWCLARPWKNAPGPPDSST